MNFVHREHVHKDHIHQDHSSERKFASMRQSHEEGTRAAPIYDKDKTFMIWID